MSSLICPKCTLKLPEESTWQKTKLGRNWIKMPGGEWHDCNRDKPFTDPNKKRVRKLFCHECNTRTIDCDEYDCQSCQFDPYFCPKCDSHVSVFDVE